MNRLCATIFFLTLMGCVGAAATASHEGGSSAVATAAFLSEPPVGSPAETTEDDSVIAITLRIGENDFPATLTDSEAARALVSQLPMTAQMSELNGQEKFYTLPDSLPAAATERPSTLSSGDIFCWSGNTLVLFYKTFQNSYGGYVRLGAVDDPTELAAALGSGSAEVTWLLAK